MAGLAWPFSTARTEAARALADTVSQVSRQPGFFGEGRAPDTLEGRLEILTLHGCLTLLRLGGRDEEDRKLAQTFANVLFRDIDAGLREAAVGDLSVPRRMRKIAGQFYGRLAAYEAALPERAALAAAFERNIFAGRATPFAGGLADYARAAQAVLAEAPSTVLADRAAWPAPPA